MRHLVPSIISLAALLTVPTSALAQDGTVSTPAAAPVASTFEIAPETGSDPTTTAQGYFVYELAAGTEATGRVRLSNPGTEPVTIELAGVDAETAQAGGSAYAAADATPVAVGSWVRLGEGRVTLEPGEQKSVAFSVAPPLGTAPGQYLAGIVAYIPAAPDRTLDAAGMNQASAGIIVQTRYVIGVQVDVPGEWTPSLTITGAEALEQPSGTKLGIAIRNDGDIFLEPEGSVTLSNAVATPILEQPIQLDTVVTGTDIVYPIAWPGVPQAGKYAVDVELHYADDKVARYSGMLAVSEDAPAAQPVPEDVAQPAAAPAPAPSPIPPRMPYLIGGLLVLIAVSLILVLFRLVRGGRRQWDW